MLTLTVTSYVGYWRWQAMLGTLTVASYVGCTDSHKLCWVHWQSQSMLGALTVTSYVGCTDSHKLCWVHWQSQSMLGALTVTSYVGCTDSHKLCWVHWQSQSMLGALTVTSYVGCTDSHKLHWVHWQSVYAGCTDSHRLHWVQWQEAMAPALTVRLDSEGICCSVRKQTALYQSVPTQWRISKTMAQLYTFLHCDHLPAAQSDSHRGNSAAGPLNTRKETGMLDWGRWHDNSGWGVKLNGTPILPQAAE